MFAAIHGSRARMAFKQFAGTGAVVLLACAALCASALGQGAQPAPPTPAPAQSPRPNAAVPASDPFAVPGFWDPRRRPERPDLSRITGIRFLTEFDYPPFNYAGTDGQPAGFNVDLARAICEEIKNNCTIQARRFDTLLEALTTN